MSESRYLRGMSTADRERLTNEILDHLTGTYRVEQLNESSFSEGQTLYRNGERFSLTGEIIQGESWSHLRRELQASPSWRVRGGVDDFWGALEELGFKFVQARNSRGGHATVVTV